MHVILLMNIVQLLCAVSQTILVDLHKIQRNDRYMTFGSVIATLIFIHIRSVDGIYQNNKSDIDTKN